MTKILLVGCNGRMGKVITELAAADADAEITAGVDVAGESCGKYPVSASFDDVSADVDVIVDFSSPVVFDKMLDEIRHYVRSANMSLGINLLIKLVKEATQTLSKAGFDIEIVERHHNQKKDAPSGTALMLADSVREGMGGECEYVYDRTGRLQKRDPKEVGISAVRGGTIPGTHEVIFAGTDEVIELNHMAYSRSIFGKGAVSAAKFLAGKREGYYSMADVIGS